jgi:Cu(I)/Ag(I) efflux system membrane fusion protein
MSEQQSTTPTTPPPAAAPRARRFGAGALVVAFLLGGGGGAALTQLLAHDGESHGAHAAATGAGPARPAAKKQQFICPMHPTIVMDHQGDCPLCGMKLVPMGGEGAAAGASGERRIAFYRNPHDPNDTSHDPKKDAMGMDFVPVYEDEVAGGAKVQGLAEVAIDPQRQQLIGLRTAEAERGPVGGSWRTAGRVAVNESRVHHTNVKFGGFVEEVFVDFTGRAVRRGEPLFSIYSPEVVSAQNEYLLARRTQEALAKSGMMQGSAEELIAAARQRLQLWDIPDSVIAELDRTGRARRTIPLASPMSGVVTKKDIVMGAWIEAGAMPYEITDLSTVWVLADVYESELSNVKVGMPAELTLASFPNRVFKGKVIFIDPLLGKETRTAKVRLEFPNPKGELKPEMFGEVVLKSGERWGLKIPADAVVRSGTQDVVFVATGEGKFQPREVKLGASDREAVEVVSGLREGDRVVTRANFLVDSESRLRASLAAMRGE